MINIAVVGAGSWGRALALSLVDNHLVSLYCYNQQELDVANTHTHKNITTTLDIAVVANCSAILLVVPSYAFADTLDKIIPYINNNQHMAWATKGFDNQNHSLLHETFNAKIPTIDATLISGPSFANEVMQKKPTALVVSGNNSINNKYWANIIQNKYIRAYTNTDIIGAQIGGAVKNILAIAAGIVAGLEYGSNTQAALITRGLSEITRLGLQLGARKETFMGLTGIGDLILTCADDLSRNRSFGKYLVKYGNIDIAKSKVNGTIEGLNSLDITLNLAKKYKVEMPICQQVYRVINYNTTPQQAIDELMAREQVEE